MICQTKSIKTQKPKSPGANESSIPAEREVETTPVSWSPFTAGPYLVPVTRWTE